MQTLSFHELESEIRSGRFQPVYLFFGPEVYLLRDALSLLKQKVPAPGTESFNCSEYSAPDLDVAEIVESANTFPMMSPRRLVLVADLDQLSPAGQDALVSYAESPQQKTVLVLNAGSIDKLAGFTKRMAEHAWVVQFGKMKDADLEQWASSYLSRRGFRIASQSLARLVDLAGSDLAALVGELEKLCLYAGEQKEIKEADILTLVQASRQHGIFELTTAMGKRDRKLALKLLGNLLEAGEPALYVVTMMARHFRHLIIAKELISQGRSQQDISTALQWKNTYFLPELMRHAKAIDLETARTLYRHVARVDRKFKSSSPDERLLLEHLICSL
ncbi:MAG: DNA polymerase III subunit delta [Acidobacteriota bacterium]